MERISRTKTFVTTQSWTNTVGTESRLKITATATTIDLIDDWFQILSPISIFIYWTYHHLNISNILNIVIIINIPLLAMPLLPLYNYKYWKINRKKSIYLMWVWYIFRLARWRRGLGRQIQAVRKIKGAELSGLSISWIRGFVHSLYSCIQFSWVNILWVCPCVLFAFLLFVHNFCNFFFLFSAAACVSGFLLG